MKTSILLSEISEEEALKYVPWEEDRLGSPKVFYTLTPSKNKRLRKEGGWEDITYYTNRLREIKFHSSDIPSQWIYILSNPSIPGLVKIGFTKEKPLNRMKQINSDTGVAEDFKLEYAFPCFNAHSLEREIHKYLNESGFRINPRKEFFNISVGEAISVVERLGASYSMKNFKK